MAHEHNFPNLEDVKECATALLGMLFGNEPANTKKIIAHIWTLIGYALGLFYEWDQTPVIGTEGPQQVDLANLTEDEKEAVARLAATSNVPMQGPLSAWIIRAAIAKAIAELWDMLKAFLEGIEKTQVVRECDCECCKTLLEEIAPLTTAVAKIANQE